MSWEGFLRRNHERVVVASRPKVRDFAAKVLTPRFCWDLLRHTRALPLDLADLRQRRDAPVAG